LVAHLLDGLVDEGLLAGKFLERRLEVAAAELGHAGHGLLLDRDVAGHHIVDAMRHALE
jgi:hypothetical protein